MGILLGVDFVSCHQRGVAGPFPLEKSFEAWKIGQAFQVLQHQQFGKREAADRGIFNQIPTGLIQNFAAQSLPEGSHSGGLTLGAGPVFQVGEVDLKFGLQLAQQREVDANILAAPAQFVGFVHTYADQFDG